MWRTRVVGAAGCVSSSVWLLIVNQTTVARATPFSILTVLENNADGERWETRGENWGECIGKLVRDLAAFAILIPDAGIMTTPRRPKVATEGRIIVDIALLDRGMSMLLLRVERQRDGSLTIGCDMGAK